MAVELLGSGPPLVLLHGWTLDRRMWRPQLPLARDFLLVGIDRRGFGQSTAAADLTLEASDIAAVAASLGLSRFHLLGMSQGGRVALAFAATARDRLLSLTLQGTALDGVASDDEQVPTRAMAAAAARGDLAAMRARWRGHALMRSTTAAGSALLAEMLADYDGRDLTAPRRGLPVTADCIAGLPCPVTAIVGAEDSGRRLPMRGPWRRRAQPSP